MAERIDIQINDKINSNVDKKIRKIANSAERAHRGIEKLKTELASINVNALNKLANASAKITNALARETQAKAKIVVANGKVAESNAKVAISQQRLATEAQRTAAAQARAQSVVQAANDKTAQSNAKVAISQQKVATEAQRTVAAQARAKTAQQQLSNTRSKAALINNQVAISKQRLRQAIVNTTAAIKRAAKASLGLSKAQGKLKKSTNSSSQSFRGFVGTLTSFLGLAVSGRALVGFVDSFTNLENRLKLVTDTTNELKKTTEDVFGVAERSRVGVEDTVRAYQRFERALKALGREQGESLRLTETLNKALILSGATTGEQTAGLLQLSQAFNKGKLDGDEFRTVMELLPTVSEAIAREMGVMRGELLELAPQGKITGEVMANALSNVAKQVDRDFAEIVPTVSSAFTNLRTAAIKTLGEFEKKTGVFELFAKGVLFLAQNIRVLALGLTVVGTAITVSLVPSIYRAITALQLFNIAAITSPIGIFVIALSTLVAAVLLLGDTMRDTNAYVSEFEDLTERAASSAKRYADAQNDLVVANKLNRPDDAVRALKEQDRAIVDVIKSLTKLDAKERTFGGKVPISPENIKKVSKELEGFNINLKDFVTTQAQGFGSGDDFGGAFSNLPEIKVLDAQAVIKALEAETAKVESKVKVEQKKIRKALLIEQEKTLALVKAELDGSGVDLGGADLTAEQKKKLAELKKVNNELQKQVGIQNTLGSQRGTEKELLKILNDLKKEGIELTAREEDLLRKKLEANNKDSRVMDKVNQLLKQNKGALEEAAIGIEALNRAKEKGIISDQQFVSNLVKMNMELQKTQLLMGEGGFGDALTVGLGSLVANYENALTSLSQSFGNFFEGVTDGFADSIGRAIVMGEDLEASLKSVAQNALAELISSFIKLGIQYAVNAALGNSAMAATTATSVAAGTATAAAWATPAALVSLASFGANGIPAAGAIASVTALTRALSIVPGFESGGYTGNVGTSEVAGVVHGREFVMNAGATSRNRDTLEAMNRGASVSSNGGNVTALNVTVENYGSSEISVEQISATDVRIIAKDVASRTIREEAPGVIASDISNANGRVSKSLAGNTSVTRKR